MAPYFPDHTSRLHQQHNYTKHIGLHDDDDDDNHLFPLDDHTTAHDELLYLEEPPALSLSWQDAFGAPDFLSAMTTTTTTATTTMPHSPMQHYLTIEELRLARNSCWLCGCNWQQDHVSLDCPECGGYALSRPCPNCDGKCEQVWKRNINTTHDSHKATWIGQCSMLHTTSKQQTNGQGVPNHATITTPGKTTTATTRAAPTNQSLATNIGGGGTQIHAPRSRDKMPLAFESRTTTTSVAGNHCDRHAKTFPSLGQRALTKNLCPV